MLTNLRLPEAMSPTDKMFDARFLKPRSESHIGRSEGGEQK
jgi:hypothetical protein